MTLLSSRFSSIITTPTAFSQMVRDTFIKPQIISIFMMSILDVCDVDRMALDKRSYSHNHASNALEIPFCQKYLFTDRKILEFIILQTREFRARALLFAIISLTLLHQSAVVHYMRIYMSCYLLSDMARVSYWSNRFAHALSFSHLPTIEILVHWLEKTQTLSMILFLFLHSRQSRRTSLMSLGRSSGII